MPEQQTETETFDIVGFINKLEDASRMNPQPADEFPDSVMEEGFQHLVSSGIIRGLAKSYQIVAWQMVEAGVVTLPEDPSVGQALEEVVQKNAFALMLAGHVHVKESDDVAA